MPQESRSRKLDQYIVRFPDGMRDRLKSEAEANGRSLNSEIVQRLEDSFKDQGQREEALYFRDIVERLFEDNAQLRATIDELAAQIRDLRQTDDEALERAFESESQKLRDRLSRYLDMDINAHGDVSDFVVLEREGRDTKSRVATPEELAEMGLPPDEIVIVTGFKKLPKEGAD